MFWSRGPISFFCMWQSSYPSTICWKQLSFPLWMELAPCQKHVDHICEGLFLGSQFYSIGLYVCPYASPTVVTNTLMTIHSAFSNHKYESFNFLVFQDCFACLGSLDIPYEFEDWLFCFWRKKKKSQSEWWERWCWMDTFVHHFGEHRLPHNIGSSVNTGRLPASSGLSLLSAGFPSFVVQVFGLLGFVDP